MQHLSEYLREIEDCRRRSSCSDYPIPPTFSYRGQSNKDYELLPAIARCGVIDGLDQERNLIESAKRRLLNYFTDSLSPLNLLALLQHHGIPTRLLDITDSPLAALYFACNGEEENDGEVLVFAEHQWDTANYPI